MPEHRCTEFISHGGQDCCKVCKKPIPRYESVADAIAAMRAKLATTRWRDTEQRKPLPKRTRRTAIGPGQ
jgi:hypothetical protein